MLVVSVGDRVSDDLVALALGGEEFLEGDYEGDDEGDLADDEGLEGDQGEGAEGDRDEGGGLQLQEQQDRQEALDDLLLLAASCDSRNKEER